MGNFCEQFMEKCSMETKYSGFQAILKISSFYLFLLSSESTIKIENISCLMLSEKLVALFMIISVNEEHENLFLLTTCKQRKELVV